MKSVTRWLSGLAAGALLTTSIGLVAGPVSVPNSFTSGTPARAADVNANFSAVATAINDNSSRLSALEANANTPDLALTGNLVLGGSNATAGNILKGGATFIHNFGQDNTFVGVSAGNLTTTGVGNTAVGIRALGGNTSGLSNTAVGANALRNNTTGGANSALGWNALVSNSTGFNNTAFGAEALFSNTSGVANTALGLKALRGNSTGRSNTGIGGLALGNNTTGDGNTAVGGVVLEDNTTGRDNTAIGDAALQHGTGDFNTAVGALTLNTNTSGSNNVAVGYLAGFNLTTGALNIDIGNQGVAGEASTIRIGTAPQQQRTFIAGIRGVATANANAVPVVVDSDGQLGTLSSSRAVKDSIEDIDAASDALMKLRPVTFYYKTDQNPAGRARQYGLVAEEVAEVAPDLVAHSADGAIETVYYQFLPPMLLNEYQKQQHTIAALASRVAELERRNETLEQLVTQALAGNSQ